MSAAHTSKIRIYDLAKELKMESKRLIEEVRREGVDVSVPSNTISKELAEKIRNKYFPKKEPAVHRSIRVVKKAKHSDEPGHAPEPAEAPVPEVYAEPQEQPAPTPHAPEAPPEPQPAPEAGGGEIWFDDRLVSKNGRFVLPELEPLNPEHLAGPRSGALNLGE